MSELQIYKASAGAGKTFRLAVEYMKIALARPNNFRNILAVTFTNKATAEMKSRVIGELYLMAQGEHTAYTESLCGETGWKETDLAFRAKNCLKDMLHDYTHLSISTIDSFFQRVIRAFSREIGMNAAYQIDLDDELILEEAVDELFWSVDENRDLLEWLKQFAREKIEEGQGWNLKTDVLKLGREIYNESFREFGSALYEKLNDKAFIQDYRNDLQKIVSGYEQEVKLIGRRGLQVMEQAALSVDDFKFRKSGAANGFLKMAAGILEPGVRFYAGAEDAENLVNKKENRPEVEKAARNLQPLLARAVALYREKHAFVNTARLIVRQLYTLGILVDLQATVRKITRERGIVLISDSGSLLRKIVGESDTPFIYEKTGVFFRHFMIDEFQDTSGQQWNNFKPLVGNSLAENNLGMVVGDVKQAIYRWRGGDWNLLSSRLPGEFPANGFREIPLRENWRSTGRVVRFNNRIFRLLPIIMQQQLDREREELSDNTAGFDKAILQLYAGNAQIVARGEAEQEGYLRMRFLKKKKKKNDEAEEEEEHSEQVLNELVSQIRLLQETGVPAREMAILVRRGEDAGRVADRLLAEKEKEEKYNFNVLSSESLLISQAPSVSLILALLRLLFDPEDRVAMAQAVFLYRNEIRPLLEELGLSLSFPEKQSPEPEEDLHSRSRMSMADVAAELNGYRESLLYAFLSSSSFRDTLGRVNLQETVFRICRIFRFFELPKQLPYLQAFVDQLTGFLQNRKSDLSSFLHWWDEKGKKKTISISEEPDAIRIQTIHKSKGLEYNYVFIPFCDWTLDISARHAPVLWCRTGIAPFDRLELVPVRYEKKMGESLFADAYLKEKMNHYIDNLNLLYVAFTRARQALFCWSEVGDRLNSAGDLLYAALKLDEETGCEAHEMSLSSHFRKEEQLLEIGDLKAVRGKRVSENKIRLEKFCFSDFGNYLKLRKNYENFFEEEHAADRNINRGRLIHEVLARIRQAGELEHAVRELVFRGMLEKTEAEELKKQLHRMIADPGIRNWFDGSYRVINERNILTGAGGLKRPDRIMIDGNRIIVVDYKSGEQELDKYRYQLRSYMKALRACGYAQVDGYIWYTRSNKRVKVSPD